MRVLFIIDNLGSGGAERTLLDLTTALARQGHTASVAALCPPYTLAPEFAKHGVMVHQVALSHRWNLTQAIPRVRRLIAETEADVVHGHLFFGGLVTALARSAPVRRIVTFHNLAYESFPPITAWLRLRRRIEARAMRHGIDRHIAVSRAVAEHYGRHLGLAHIDVIPNGLVLPAGAHDASDRAAKFRRRYDIPATKKLVLFAGSFKPQKGHEVLVEAVRLAVRAGGDLHLGLAGDGARRAAIEEQVEAAGLRPVTTFFGLLDRSAMVDALAACEVVAMASHGEGFPLATIEAMAMERPVIATDVGGQPEIITNELTGLLVPPGNPQALADGLLRLLGDSALRDRLGTAGRLHIEALCDIDEIAGRHVQIYRGSGGIIAGGTD